MLFFLLFDLASRSGLSCCFVRGGGGSEAGISERREMGGRREKCGNREKIGREKDGKQFSHGKAGSKRKVKDSDRGFLWPGFFPPRSSLSDPNHLASPSKADSTERNSL
jgi:hypothetical protein